MGELTAFLEDMVTAAEFLYPKKEPTLPDQPLCQPLFLQQVSPRLAPTETWIVSVYVVRSRSARCSHH